MSTMPPSQTVTAVTIPRWLEINERRGHTNTGRYLRHYVISPNLSAEDAALLADTLTRHERWRRQAKAYRDYSGYVLTVGVVLIVGFSVLRWHVIASVLVALGVLLFERFGAEVSVKAKLPVDLEALQDYTSATLFHPITPTEYYRATRYARRSSTHTVSLHQAMWRAYELEAIAANAEDEYTQHAATLGNDSDEVVALAERVEELAQAANEAHDKLLGMLDPNHQSVLTAAEALSDLSSTITEALETWGSRDEEPAEQDGEDIPAKEDRQN